MPERDFSYQFYGTTAEAWDAMYQAITDAQKSIYWEVFIFVDDTIGKRFIEALLLKAKAGVEIKIIIDAIGSFHFSWAAERQLREAGIEILRYSHLYPEFKVFKWFNRIVHRNHRKVLIVDEKIVFLGGVNVGDRFRQWGDVYLKIIGKIARPLLRGFAKSYVASGGTEEHVWHLLHPKLSRGIPAWRERLKFIVHSPRLATLPKAKKIYIEALAMAQESVNLLTPYYVPDKSFLKAVALARQRGVKVNIFLPLRPDHKFMELLGRAYYGLTLKAGANIYLLPTMHHGKALSVDGKLGHVGSINLTHRVNFDEESGVSFSDAGMVRDLNTLFNTIKETAVRFDENSWLLRGRWTKFKEWLARTVEKYV